MASKLSHLETLINAHFVWGCLSDFNAVLEIFFWKFPCESQDSRLPVKLATFSQLFVKTRSWWGPGNTGRAYEQPWESPAKPMKTHGGPWKPMRSGKTHGNRAIPRASPPVLIEGLSSSHCENSCYITENLNDALESGLSKAELGCRLGTALIYARCTIVWLILC